MNDHVPTRAVLSIEKMKRHVEMVIDDRITPEPIQSRQFRSAPFNDIVAFFAIGGKKNRAARVGRLSEAKKFIATKIFRRNRSLLPIMMKRPLAIDALESVRAEVIALCLDQIRAQPFRAELIDVL